MSFSDKLKIARCNKGLTQQQLADKLGLERSSIAHYEAGNSMPNLKNVYTLCSILDISIDELLKP